MSEEQTPATTEASDDETATKDDKTMGMLCHLLGIFTWFIGPLIIYILKKDDSPYIKHHAGEALNFAITLTIAYFVSFIAMAITLGILFFLPMGVAIAGLVFFIIATIKANDGVLYKYPISLRLIK
ncbi:DUF4870 domain-containing protein [Poriferisphaera sp. WC338]|uniref:DUF4870 domain-containing protein n=1 Tax=Poriferisphaera sp. WC338 TaxID=3425129 RepID=UPI003D81BCA0